jgi:hypothetical protein
VQEEEKELPTSCRAQELTSTFREAGKRKNCPKVIDELLSCCRATPKPV